MPRPRDTAARLLTAFRRRPGDRHENVAASSRVSREEIVLALILAYFREMSGA